MPGAFKSLLPSGIMWARYLSLELSEVLRPRLPTYLWNWQFSCGGCSVVAVRMFSQMRTIACCLLLSIRTLQAASASFACFTSNHAQRGSRFSVQSSVCALSIFSPIFSSCCRMRSTLATHSSKSFAGVALSYSSAYNDFNRTCDLPNRCWSIALTTS